MGLQASYTAANPPTPNYKPKPLVTDKNVPITDGSERQLSDRDGFLKLFITQLQHQDPMNPMENTEMTAQLAQFSQLEQLANLNTSFSSMLGSMLAQNQFQSLSMIGKSVKAESNALSLKGGELSLKADFEILEPAKVFVTILDENGKTVRVLDLETLDKGAHDLEWDGHNDSGEKVSDGLYFFKVGATNSQGEEVQAYPSIKGKVSSVTFDSNGQPLLHIDNALISLAQVMEILQAEQAQKPSTEDKIKA